MDKMDTRIAAAVEKYALIEHGDSVLVALSGGPDSVALLYLLYRAKTKYNIALAAAHLDHRMRTDSTVDREFCRKLCKILKIRFHSKKANIPAISSREKISPEVAGRKARYEYLERLAKDHGYDKIATGHTADDNAETVIFNLARGSGLVGLAGIPARRGKIIRPLLEIPKKEILAWLRDNSIAYKLDPSNRSLKHARNRIRHKIMPHLERLNPASVNNILRFSRILAEEIELIDDLTVSAYEKSLVERDENKIVLDLAKIKSYDRKLGKKVVMVAFRDLSDSRYNPSFDVISGAETVLDGAGGGKSQLGGGIWAEKSKHHISLFRPFESKESLRLNIPGTTRVPSSDLFLKTEVLNRAGIVRLKIEPEKALLDKALISNGMIRFWENGDKIRPLGMKGRRLLSDIFSERGIPSYKRRQIPLLVSDGRIAWIAGIMISDDFKVGKETKKVLSVELCGQS